MVVWSDVPLLALCVALAVHPSGPVGVLTFAAGLVHFLHSSGKPRVQLAAAYLCLPVALACVLRGGFFVGSVPPPVYTVTLCILVAAAAVFDWLLPGVQSLSRHRRGGLAAACAVTHVQLPHVDFVLRVYYPTLPARGAERLPYLLHGGSTVAGLAAFMKMPSAALDWVRYARSGGAYVADPDNAMVASAEDVERLTRGGAALGGGGSCSRHDLPVAIFSHGLGGTPDFYSELILAWVRRGYVVLAPEHADGSAAFTAFPDGSRLSYVPLTPGERADRGLEYRRRHGQLKQRVREVRACVAFLEAAAAYDPAADSTSEADDATFVKLLLCDRISLGSGVCAVGHSFGGATCLSAAAKEPRISAVVALDAWAFPLSPFVIARGLPATPVLSIVGDGFAVWRENASALKALLSPEVRAAMAAGAAASATVSQSTAAAKQRRPAAAAAGKGDGDEEEDGEGIAQNGFNVRGEVDPMLVLSGSPHPGNVLLRLTGAQHQNFNDFALLLGWLGRRMRLTGQADAVAALDAISAASALFAAQHCAPPRPREQLQPPRVDRYAAFVSPSLGVAGARLFERDDGPAHTPAAATAASAAGGARDSRAEAEAEAAPHGNPDERGAVAQT